MDGYFGIECKNQCPFNNLGIICSGRGECSQGTNGTGLCSCNKGWAGSNCEIECPGGSDDPCRGHGVCMNSGVCRCQASSTTGYK